MATAEDSPDREDDWEAVLAAFEQHLAAERGRSPATCRAYRTDLASLAEHARRMRRETPAELDLSVLRSWLAGMRSRGASAATMGRRASAARTFTGWAARRGRPADRRRGPAGDPAASADPAAGPADRRRRRAVFTDLPAGDGPGRSCGTGVVVEVLYGSALRVSELCGLDLDDVDTARRLLRVIGKGDRERRVPYGVPAQQALESWLAAGRPRAGRAGQRAGAAARARGAAGWTRGPLGERCTRPSRRPRGCPIWPRTEFDTAQRLTCWSRAPI